MEYTREFEYLWKVYPKRYSAAAGRKVGKKKWPAFEKWQKLPKVLQDEILTKAKFIREFEGDYPRDLVTWLNQRGWDDIEFKADYIPMLPEELTQNIGNIETKVIDLNDRRNEQIRRLKA
jgi:hypothetical protein